MSDSERLDELLDQAFAPGEHRLAVTHAVLVKQHGETIVERYNDGFDATSSMISWSMAKSVLNAAVGMLVAEERLSLDAPAPVEEWQGPNDPRSAITLRHLLEMRSGLEWLEEYTADGRSDVVDMLFRAGKVDTAGFAIAKPLAHPPGEQYYYSSGTSNIISRIVGEELGGQEAFEMFLQDRLFAPAGMTDCELRFDPAGTWIGSSFLHTTARSYARFGELFLNGCVADGTQIVEQDWIAASVRSHAIDDDNGQGYGLHWWIIPDDRGMFAASGFEGQRIQVAPQTGVVLVRLGATPEDNGPELRAFYDDVMRCFET